MKRDVKVATSVPVIAACGVGLGVLLMGVFLLEAFVSEIYEGLGQGIVVRYCNSYCRREYKLTYSLLSLLLYSSS